jgi:AcrR family transcriptional regulator
MKLDQPAGRDVAQRSEVRIGRPPRELAGKVDEKILDAAAKVFLERGFSGASVDEIAEVARAGKPTIYARFPGKEALFVAVIERLVLRNSGLEAEAVSAAGASIEERLAAIATVILTAALVPEGIGLVRVAVAEARRFPHVATSVGRMVRERNIQPVSLLLAEFAGSARGRGLIALAPDRLAATALRFLNLAVLPLLLRALFGEDLAVLRAEIGPHVADTVPFFLAACERQEAVQ